MVDPGFMVEGPNGSVIADPAKFTVAESTPAPKAEERPSWLPEKFKTAEDFAKSYTELEQKLGTQKPADAPAALTPESVTEKGFDMKQLQAEYADKGDITPETRAKLAEKGITGAAVDQYIAGVKAQNEQVRSDFAKLAGGDEQLTSVIEWAKTGLSADEIAGYDALLDSGNHAAAKIAFQGIVARYTAENGDAPALVQAERTPSTPGVKPFESWEQVTKEMGKSDYKNDPAFRAKVAQRLSVSELR